MSRAVTRRDALAGAAATALTAVSRPALATAADPSLGAAAAAKGILFGASLMVREFDRPHGDAYAEMYAREARIVTSDVELKMSVLRPAPGALNYEPADRFAGFARRHAMIARGHTLIWNDDLPKWIGALGQRALGEFMDDHIARTIARYGEGIAVWDVVNEPIAPWDRNDGNLRSGAYFDAFGEGYILRAFKAARTASAAAKLVLNEAQMEPETERSHTFRSSFRSLLERLKDQGAPIDAIGFQAHLQARDPADYPAFAAYLADIADMGFDIHITELDVNDTGVAGSIDERDRRVAEIYDAFLAATLQVPAVRVVQTWQLSDATTWYRDPTVISPKDGVREGARPLPYDDAFRRKPAWNAMLAAFENAPTR